MPRVPKQQPEDQPDRSEKDSWGEDQTKREYYYDDAHGYESYDPAEDEDDDEEVSN